MIHPHDLNLPHLNLQNVDLPHLDLLDLLAAVVVCLAVLGALRRGAGLLAAVATGLVTVLALWLAAAAVITLGPHDLSASVARSGFAQTLSPPTRAVDQLVELTR